MARQLNDVLEIENENEKYREILYLAKSELQRIRNEYFLGAKAMSEMAIDEVDEELEALTLTIENVLF